LCCAQTNVLIANVAMRITNAIGKCLRKFEFIEDSSTLERFATAKRDGGTFGNNKTVLTFPGIFEERPEPTSAQLRREHEIPAAVKRYQNPQGRRNRFLDRPTQNVHPEFRR
jgi:hypothetical protein